MANNLSAGDDAYVVVSRVPELEQNQSSAFKRVTIADRQKRSLSIVIAGGAVSDFISSKYFHRTVGAAILTLGDYESETATLDPLAKTVLQNCRLLLGDDSFVRHFKIRTLEELRALATKGLLNAFDHIVIVGHGSRDGNIRVGDQSVGPTDFANALVNDGHRTWKFLLSCCELGRAAFAKSFSEHQCVEYVIAPFHSVHPAVASTFIQTFLLRTYLEGETPLVAFRSAADVVWNRTSLRFWINGTQ